VASHASIRAGGNIINILRNLQTPSDYSSHITEEEKLHTITTNSNAKNSEVTYEHDEDKLPYWGYKMGLHPNNSIIIMPLKLDNSSNRDKVNYESCQHDIAAIHQDALLDRNQNDWTDSLDYLADSIGKCLKRVKEGNSMDYTNHDFHIVIFEDLQDLQIKVADKLGVNSEFENDSRKEDAEYAEMLSGQPSNFENQGINLRSLHILLPEDNNAGAIDSFTTNSKLSSYMLCIMKQFEADLDLGRYSIRIDGCFKHQAHAPEYRLTNFIDLVTSFLMSRMISPENVDSFSNLTRIGTITKFFKRDRKMETSFSFTINKDTTDLSLSQIPHGFKSWTGIYRPGSTQTFSGYYKWLNQCNLRIFHEPLFQGAVKENDWTARVFFKAQKERALEKFTDLEKDSGYWKTECENFRNTNKDWKKNKSQSFNFYCSLLEKLRGIGTLDNVLNEIKNEVAWFDSSHKSQLQFYAFIAKEFNEIWSNLSAPYTHHGLSMKYSHLVDEYSIRFQDLEIISYYELIGDLCEKICQFQAGSWSGFSEWKIEKVR